MWLSHVIYSSVSQTVSAAATAMDWLRAAAKVAAEGGLPLWWTTPMGLPILQEYKEQTGVRVKAHWGGQRLRSEEHTSELQSLMRISYAVFCLNKTTIISSTRREKNKK